MMRLFCFVDLHLLLISSVYTCFSSRKASSQFNQHFTSNFLQKCCDKHLHMKKKLYAHCWWNWHLGLISPNFVRQAKSCRCTEFAQKFAPTKLNPNLWTEIRQFANVIFAHAKNASREILVAKKIRAKMLVKFIPG